MSAHSKKNRKLAEEMKLDIDEIKSNKKIKKMIKREKHSFRFVTYKVIGESLNDKSNLSS